MRRKITRKISSGESTPCIRRVGKEDVIHFAGESFVVDPHGRIIAQASKEKDHILYADCDFQQVPQSHAKKHFFQDRRPDFYRVFNLLD
jgi:beta-ureidopropionase